MEGEHLHQQLNRLGNEMTSLNSQNDQLEQTRDCLQQNYHDKKAKCAELTQDVQRLRSQLKHVTDEHSEMKREFAGTQRDLDKVRGEADDAKVALQEKQGECRELHEENSCLSSRLASLQCRLESETCQLTQQLGDLRNRLEKEIEQLKLCRMDLEETNANLVQKVTTLQRQLAQAEKGFSQRMESVSRENEMLRTKLEDKEDQLLASKDCLTIKDSEIMRLKLRMCSMDRCNTGGPDTCCTDKNGSGFVKCMPGCSRPKNATHCGAASCGAKTKCCDDWKTIEFKKKQENCPDS